MNKSYLSNRKQYAPINCYVSDFTTIKFSFPQRLVVGPLIYFDDLNEAIQFCKVYHSPDDAISYET